MAFRAVIFDLDDTLIEEEAVARASVRSTGSLIPGVDTDRAEDVILATARRIWRAGPYHRLAVELGIASWEGLWASFEGCHPSLDGLAAWAPSYRRQAWEAAVAELGRPDPGLALAMAGAYEAAQRVGHRLLDGAGEAVRSAAAAGHRLGLLTNGPADIQRLKLDQSGLGSYFDVVVISGAAGTGKPSPEAFNLVLEALEVTPQEAVMVGDSWERDVKGATAAGIAAIWIAAGRPVPGGESSVSVIPSIGALGPELSMPAAK
ncbi:MAG: HAD family hydrolase [Acidimicrobiales bacterium]